MRRSFELDRIAGIANTDRGLTDEEVSERLREYGGNHILESHASSMLTLLKDAAADPMLWFLLATGILFFVLGDRIEAATLFLAMLPLVGMDLFLHRRTRASTEGLASRLASKARVRRNGREAEIAAEELVPGDLVLLRTGDMIPADGFLVRDTACQVDESVLTGEAFPVQKESAPKLDPGAQSIGLDARHWAFAGTRLLAGTAEVRVTHTGGETLYGEIVRSAVAGSQARTPLQEAVFKLVRVLVFAAVALCALLFWVRWRQGFGLLDATLSALTLAVAALPEEFPVVFTFFLGVGVYRLAQRRALVRRAVAVENIGRVTCICTDKTGTITLGEVQLAHAFPAEGVIDARLLAVAAGASRSDSGDAVDTAILRAAPQGAAHATPVATFPFAEDRRRETNVWRKDEAVLVAMSKGAPEVILARCAMDAAERDAWAAKVAALAAEAHKVIACAFTELPSTGWDGGEPERALRFAGLLAFEDPVRESVPEAIAQCRAAGIHVVMITGDHPATAAAVAREIGLGGAHPRIVEAEALAPDTALRNVDVVARALPAQKVAVVRALQAAGESVAVTGDGVNDVPALQIADVGLAMGERGTRSAREVAAIVLLDENFRTIIRAIVEGRQLFCNLRLSFAYLIMIHLPLVVSAALIPLAGYALLYLPIHIVWLELIVHPTALLAFQELPWNGALQGAPPRGRAKFFDARQWWVMCAAGGVTALMVVAGYEWMLRMGDSAEHARALIMALLALLSATLLGVLSHLRTAAARIIAAATPLLSFALIQFPVTARYLRVEPLHAGDWIAVGVGAALIGAIALTGGFRARTAG